MTITPQNVHQTLGKYMLADGLDLVLDLRKSHGCQIYNARTNEYMLDCFSFFASAPIGCNHPQLTTPEFTKQLAEVSINNPTNSDLYTTELAEFVQTFHKHAVPSYFKHLFFIAGGSPAVENGLKTAFDWKIRKNYERGSKNDLGNQVIHFKEAFHGRTGYTLSLTNTFNLNKTKYFPKFDWPRITNPKITFPFTKENEEHLLQLEEQAINEIHAAIKQHPDDIAVLIIEPIQGEGGDNHFRPQFMQQLQQICHHQEIMFMVDEIQSGVGLTGKMWAHEHHQVQPDILAFGKKTQVCGIMVGPRVDEITDNVFNVSSRLNSTWGGNLVDMVRCQKYLEIIHEEKLIKNAAYLGPRLREGLKDIQHTYPHLISNARGSGLMCAFDLPTSTKRDTFINKLYQKNIIILGCGEKTIRFRPPLIFTETETDEVLTAVKEVAKEMS